MTTNENRSAIGNRQSAILKGWIVATYTTYKGKKLGPYYSRTWKVNGKIKREYIKPADLDRVRAACQANRDRKMRGAKIAADFHNTIGNLKWLKRMEKRSEKNALRAEDHQHIDRIQTHGYSTPGRTKLRTRRSFMYPSRDNSSPACGGSAQRAMGAHTAFFNTLKQEVNKAFAAKFAQESIEEKWERWRKQHAKRPAPRPLPKARENLCVSQEWIEGFVAKLSERLDTSIAKGKSIPNWKNLRPRTQFDSNEKAHVQRDARSDITGLRNPSNEPNVSNKWNPSNFPDATSGTCTTYMSSSSAQPYVSNESNVSNKSNLHDNSRDRPFSDQLRDFQGATEK